MDDPWGDAAKTTAGGLSITFVIFLVFLVMALIAGGVTLAVQPWATHQQYLINKNSQQNVAGSTAHLEALIASYDQLQSQVAALSLNGQGSSQAASDMKGEEQQILTEMRTQLATMNASDVPPDVTQFLAQHGSP